MKKRVTLVIMIMALISSCSSDNNNDITTEIIEPSALLGWWLMTDIRSIGDPDGELIVVDEVVDQLVQLDCNLVTFLFDASGTVAITDRVNYTDFNSAQTGTNVMCPNQEDIEAAFWTLEGNVLTLDFNNGVIRTMTIRLDGNILTLDGKDMNENNFEGAEAIFTFHE